MSNAKALQLLLLALVVSQFMQVNTMADIVTPQASLAPKRFGLHSVGRDPVLISRSGARVTRAIVDWDRIQPAPGPLQFDLADRSIRNAGKRGLEITVSLRSNSSWACYPTKPKGKRRYDHGSTMPKDINKWRNLIYSLVERYDGDGIEDAPGLVQPVKAWQLENEWLPQWDGTVEELIELMRVTYQTVKEADPNATVICPGFTGLNLLALWSGTNERGWTYYGQSDAKRRKVTRGDLLGLRRGRQQNILQRADLFLREGVKYCDVVDVHIYATDIEDICYSLAAIRQRLAHYGHHKELWSLEFSAPFHDFTEERFNRSVIQAQTVGFASGLSRIYWSHLIPPGEWGANYERLSLANHRGEPTRAYYNYALTARLLDGFTSVAKLSAGPDLWLYRFDFSDPSRAVWVSWSDGEVRSLNLRSNGDVELWEMISPRQQNGIQPQPILARNGGVSVTVNEQPVFMVRHAHKDLTSN